MFIRKLKLKNFRCFKNLEIDFTDINEGNRKRTLILGENGTGKSNILKAIALVTAGSNALGELLGNPNDWIRYGTKDCRIDLELSTIKNERRHIWLELHRGDSSLMVMKRSDKSLEEIDNALQHTDRNYFIVGYGASRIMGGGKGKSNISSSFYESQRARCIASLLDRQATLISLEEWAIDLDYRKDGEAGLNIIRKVFDEFLPGIKFNKIDKQTRQLLLDTPDGIIPLNALSDGYQNMASWIGDLLYRVSDIFSDRKEPLKTSGVLLLDEIDLHLHPVWQRRLLEFIQTTLPNMQVIATTHSPFTAQQAKERELFTLSRTKKGILLEAFLRNPQELLLHQLIMSDVFGLETDESVYVENLKTEYDLLKNKSKKSVKEKVQLKKLEDTISNIPVMAYSNSLLSENDRKMLKSVLKSYNNKSTNNVKA